MHRASTAAQAESYLRLYAYPTLGHRPLGAIRRSEIQAWVKALSGRVLRAHRRSGRLSPALGPRRPQLVGVSGGVPEFGPPKSKAGFPTVPMPGVVATTLAAHLVDNLARYGPGPGGVVFTNTVGNPLWRNTVNEMWHRAGKRSGLPDWATFHDLRHFYASLLKIGDVAVAASFDTLCDRCPIRHLGFEALGVVS